MKKLLITISLIGATCFAGQLSFTTDEVDTLLEDLNYTPYAIAELITATTQTLTTATTWYPIEGVFTNEFSGFEFGAATNIVYIGKYEYMFEIDWHAKVGTDSAVKRNFNITVSINGVPQTAWKMGAKTTGSEDPSQVSGTWVGPLSSNDTVQLVIQTVTGGDDWIVGQFVTTCTKFKATRE